MGKISDIKIRKAIYRFEARKRYQNIHRYHVKKKKPLEKIKDSIRSIFAPKEEMKKKKVQAAQAPGGFNMALVGVAVAVAILILLVGFMWWQLNLITPSPAPFKAVEKGEISNIILENDVLTAGSRGTTNHVASVFVDIDTKSLKNYSVTLKTYSSELPTEYFILNSERTEAGDYNDFLLNIRKEFGSKSLRLNEISLDQLSSVPKGALIIIPSGAAPIELLKGPGNISRLLDEGVVVIYIGQSFRSYLRGTTPQDILNAHPFSFSDSSPPCSGISLFQPLYSVSGKGGISTSKAYGCVSVLKKGSGAILFVPQTLNGGWRGGPKDAAKDIARISLDVRWTSPDDSNGVSYFIEPMNDTEEISGKKLFFTKPYNGEERTVRIHFSGYSTTDTLLEDILVVRAKKKQNGELYVEKLTVTSTNITDETVRMNAKLDEPTASNPLMFIVFTDDQGNEVGRELKENINTQIPNRNLDVSINLDQGEYMVALEDDESKVYAASYLEVASVSIKGPRFSAKPSVYVFDISTPITLRSLDVNLDNGAFTKKFSDVSSGPLSIDIAPYTGGDALSYGDHTFEFTAGSLTKSVKYNRPLPPPPFPPELLLVTLLAGGIVAVGVFYARQEKVLYSLDVPDFPPVSRTKIPLSVDAVLSLFDKVNENYRWEYTPLTVTELKNGFKDLYHKGKSIYISDYNTEFVLNDLIRRKKVTDFIEYYGLNSWAKKSGHSIRYLAMLRRLRDICVNNAVPFTSLGESKVSDSEITVVGQQMFLHFYDKETVNDLVKRSLNTLGKGITIVLFKDNPEKSEFGSLLNSPTEASLVLKVEVENSSVLLLTYPELEKMVQEFKGV